MHNADVRVASFLVAVAVLLGCALGPLTRRADPRAERRRAAAASALGVADLCLSSDARWLRHPSLSEPGAAFHDLPGAPDAYPAGMVLAPPAFLYGEAAAR